MLCVTLHRVRDLLHFASLFLFHLKDLNYLVPAEILKFLMQIEMSFVYNLDLINTCTNVVSPQVWICPLNSYSCRIELGVHRMSVIIRCNSHVRFVH